MFVGKFSGEVSGENSGDAKITKNKGGFLGFPENPLDFSRELRLVGDFEFLGFGR